MLVAKAIRNARSGLGRKESATECDDFDKEETVDNDGAAVVVVNLFKDDKLKKSIHLPTDADIVYLMNENRLTIGIHKSPNVSKEQST